VSDFDEFGERVMESLGFVLGFLGGIVLFAIEVI